MRRRASSVPVSRPAPGGRRVPTYLRVVVTTRCPLSCPFCHAEGDPPKDDDPGLLADEVLVRSVEAAVRLGVRKVKFLGGEPMVRPRLPQLVRTIRSRCPDIDLSLITSGVCSAARVDQVFAAGLDRMNLSIHGWRPEAFARRGGNPVRWHARQAVLERLLHHGRPLKLNYVLAGDPDLEADVRALLAWAEGRPLVVSLLDDLGDPEAGPEQVLAFVRDLLGPPDRVEVDHDPHSLDTTHLVYRGRWRIEVKSRRLGMEEAYRACGACPHRARCREGILALRLMSDGSLRPCLDRPDLAFPLGEHARRGVAEASEALRGWLEEVVA